MMSRIGIIFAIDEEIEALKKYLEITNHYQIFELDFYEGIISDKKCLLVKSGVGKVHAARTTQMLIDHFKVDYIFNIGIAGGVSNTLSIGDIVIGERLVQHDFDITVFNHAKGYIPKVGEYVESDPYLLDLVHKLHFPNLYFGVIASGDIFCTEEAMSKKIATKFNALCVEMESASIAQVCYLNLIPFLIIRSISDIIDDHNVKTYEENIENSCQVVALFMMKLLHMIKL